MYVYGDGEIKGQNSAQNVMLTDVMRARRNALRKNFTLTKFFKDVYGLKQRQNN